MKINLFIQRTLGIQKIRRLNMSRGGREGNNAFIKDQNVGRIVQNLQIGKKIMKWNLPLKFINELIAMKMTSKDELCHNNVTEAVR